MRLCAAASDSDLPLGQINTALQLVLMGVTTINPLLGVDVSLPLKALQFVCILGVLASRADSQMDRCWNDDMERVQLHWESWSSYPASSDKKAVAAMIERGMRYA